MLVVHTYFASKLTYYSWYLFSPRLYCSMTEMEIYSLQRRLLLVIKHFFDNVENMHSLCNCLV